MKHIKGWTLFEAATLVYDADWKKIMPSRMTVLKGGEDSPRHSFLIGNVMKHADMLQVTYENEGTEWGIPSTLEFDFYFSKKDGKMRVDVDITWGEAMACEFYVESPDRLGITQYTSYHSKTDPSNTVFALEEDSLEGLMAAINSMDGFRIRRDQLNFLDKYDNYQPR